ncbi:MAG: thioredoxin family protein [Planctomycetota bacterium]
MASRRKGMLAGLAAGVAAIAAMTLVGTGANADHHGMKKAEVGKKAPDFTLVDHEGNSHTLSEYTEKGHVVVLEWFNAKCPFVVRHYATYPTMKELNEKYSGKKVTWLAINSAHEGHMTHGIDAEYAASWGIEYPILNDETGKVGKMYEAKTTPHMYIIDTDGILRYNGAIDDDPRDRKERSAKVNYVDQALGQILAGETVTQAETKAYGCSVKYAK